MSTNALDLSTLDRAICGEIYASDAAVRNLERLCQECSGRFAGSDDYRRAAEMVAELVARLRPQRRASGAVPLHGLGTRQRQPDADRAGNAQLPMSGPPLRAGLRPGGRGHRRGLRAGCRCEARRGGDSGQDRAGEERRASRRPAGASAPEIRAHQGCRRGRVPLPGRPAGHAPAHGQPRLHPGWAAGSGAAQRRRALRGRAGHRALDQDGRAGAPPPASRQSAVARRIVERGGRVGRAGA